ncbi:unnamed protein product [Rodentolepis nana]|uniref:Secreted protein n=1 Tax=Rodentolepis nana TaxID=102285 RepID=A0A0R3TGJ3_RODNA|nr:unnamed protein product [Rodentolepis nana]
MQSVRNGFDSWPKLNSATASILGQSATASIPGQSVISESANCSILSQSAISESATVHYFSLVRALSSLHLEVLNSLCSPVGYVGECHCFSFVRALISLHIEVGLSYNSLHLEVLNSLLIKVFIVRKDIGWSMPCKIIVPFLAILLPL